MDQKAFPDETVNASIKDQVLKLASMNFEDTVPSKAQEILGEPLPMPNKFSEL